MGLGTLDVDWAYQTRRLGILYVVAGIMLYTSASESLRRVINMRVWIVSYFGSILGVYSCAVDANQTARQLRRTGSADAIVTEARLNEETCKGKTLLATVPTATSCVCTLFSFKVFARCIIEDFRAPQLPVLRSAVRGNTSGR